MARLAGVDIPREKRVEVALTYIYGVGKTRAHETLAAVSYTHLDVYKRQGMVNTVAHLVKVEEVK